MARGNPQNLIKPTRDLTADERRKSASKAGKRSAQVRRWNADIKACILDKLGDDATMESLVNAMLMEAVEKGSVQAAVWLRDTAGQKPTEKASHEVSGPDGSPLSTSSTVTIQLVRANG